MPVNAEDGSNRLIPNLEMDHPSICLEANCTGLVRFKTLSRFGNSFMLINSCFRVCVILAFILSILCLMQSIKVSVPCTVCGEVVIRESFLCRIASGFSENHVHLNCADQIEYEYQVLEQYSSGAIRVDKVKQ